MYMRLAVRTCTCGWLYVQVHAAVRTYMYMRLYVRTCTCGWLYVHIHAAGCTYMYIRLAVRTCTCGWLYVHVHTAPLISELCCQVLFFLHYSQALFHYWSQLPWELSAGLRLQLPPRCTLRAAPLERGASAFTPTTWSTLFQYSAMCQVRT